ncbi:anoctamin-10 [Syngnathus acus]|uniref:anoctamin-10 n=1 Tax=Syngnathus acus TaxID=161584 RepID=UPI001885F0BB|nr:anoctamin-10 [Syngnathus acus]
MEISGPRCGPGILPQVVVVLSPETKEETVAWLLRRIREKQQEGGAELHVDQLRSEIVMEENENPNIFLVAASWPRLLSGAEDLGLFKEFSDGSMRSFTCINSHNFKEFHGDGDGFLSMAECQYIIKHELETLRAKDETHVPGYTQAKLYPGKSIGVDNVLWKLKKCVYSLADGSLYWYNKGAPRLLPDDSWDMLQHAHDLRGAKRSETAIQRILIQMFPLHDKAELKRLSFKWYKKVKTSLQPLENHRLESSYQNHLVLKVLVFNFLNCFASLFYIAFIMQDLILLRQNLATLLITSQIINQFMEALVPYWLQRGYNKKMMMELPLIEQVQLETDMSPYLGTFDDYLELFLLFGYVSLFSSVYPLAAVFVVLNNITEIYSDAFKMCNLFKRPFSDPAPNIGIWQLAFEAMSVIAIVTNCTLIGMSPQVRAYFPDSEMHLMLWTVAIEHGLLAFKFILAFLVPNIPEHIQIKLARLEFESMEALKKKDHLRHNTSPMLQAPDLP